MAPVIDLSSFIAQSLSPAFVLSGIGLLTVGLHNRMISMGGRIRQLNDELRKGTLTHRSDNVHQQIDIFMQRIRLARNSLFLLYGAMGLMVFTALAIALHDLGIFFPAMSVPVWSFIGGLFLILLAVLEEAASVTLNLRSLEMDIDSTHAIEQATAETLSAVQHPME